MSDILHNTTVLIRNPHGIRDWQRFLTPSTGRVA